MSEVKKYRLGNKPEEYELSESFLGWVPEFMKSWEMFHYEYSPGSEYPSSVTLVSPEGEKKMLNLHQRLCSDAFPMNFFGEARSKKWSNFLRVSELEKPEIKFIIPMH